MVNSLITWDEQSCTRFLDASVYTGFHKKLAQKILPFLEPGDTLCDIGCGLGRLDLELAPFVSGILAVDVSEYAIKMLETGIRDSGVENIRTHCGDAMELTPGFDVIVMSMYGKSDILKILGRCRRRFIKIVSASKKSGLYPERHRREVKNLVPVEKAGLESLGIDYMLDLCSIEFGQPLRTWQDAEAFVLSNAPEADSGEINAFLDENIKRTGREDFPLYLPYQKELGIFVVDARS